MALPTKLRSVGSSLSGLYALYGYHPFSHLSRRIRAKTGRTPTVPTRLKAVHWTQFFKRRIPHLVEMEKRSGNVRVSELALLALASAECAPGATIFEIGTFDGRTTLNLAWNAPDDAKVFTLDLPVEDPAALPIEAGENYLQTQRLQPGARFREGVHHASQAAGAITQLLCDSATFEPDSLEGKCALVFVDGSHSEDYARSDTELALRLAAQGATIIWHDYGIWPGLTKALESCEEERALGIVHLSGTSLAACRLV